MSKTTPRVVFNSTVIAHLCGPEALCHYFLLTGTFSAGRKETPKIQEVDEIYKEVPEI